MSYKNIAQIYAFSRPEYPQELFSHIISYVPLENRDLYIDLGCGTGELLFPLSIYFKQSIGVDVEEAMLEVASQKRSYLEQTSIDLVNSSAEQYVLHLPLDTQVDLVTAGRCFHWMDQKVVVQEVYHRLRRGGIFVTLGEVVGGIWRKDADWAQEVYSIIFNGFANKELFRPIRGKGTPLEIMQDALRSVPFREIQDNQITVKQQWNIDTIVNLFYSAAGFLDWLGDDKEVFEERARKKLFELAPSGIFYEMITFGITCCKK